MIIRLIEGDFQPEGSSVTLHIPKKDFTGTDATNVMNQVRIFVAEHIIPHIPFTNKDDDARKTLLVMSNSDFATKFMMYLAIHGKPDAATVLPFKDDAAIIDAFARFGFLRVLLYS